MKNLEEILEIDKIKEQILKFNINELSKKRILNLKPFYIKERVFEELEKTKEGYALKNLGTLPNLAQLIDVSFYLKTLGKNGVLNLKEIYDFYYHFQIIEEIKKFKKEKKESFAFFDSFVDQLFYSHEIVDRIQYCIAPNLTLYDHASTELKNIRKNIKKCEEEIKVKLASYVKNNAEMLTDTLIVSRGNHLVIPVKATYKNVVKGVVIDVSDSAQTYYIEPYSVVEINIQLESLRYEEQLEEKRIIKAICLIIQKYLSQIEKNNEMLEEISFMYLKGNYGISKDYEIASLNDSCVELIQAKHPLISPLKVVSNDYILGKNNQNILVISGPNAGGKTVSLKTVSLLVYMNQCGLPLPVKEASLKVFSDIFVDIGDDQSIEQSLSGFSSHIAKVSQIVSKVNENSLVILDELGSKTDPQEGEALAKAIIDYIDDKKAIALITTHYIGIKDFAKESNSILLSSMSFNEETMEPTYKLLLNIVGRSYALEISKRLGLNESIIEKAKSYKDQHAQTLEQLIDSLNQKLKEEETKISQLEEKERELDSLKQEILHQKQQLQIQQKEILEKYELEQEELLEETKLKIDELILDLESKNQENFKLHHKTTTLQKLDQLQKKEKIEIANHQELQVHDQVYIESLHQYGIIKEIKNQNVFVLVNNTSLKLSKNEVKKVERKKEMVKPKVHISHTHMELPSIPTSLNVVGYHIEEALKAVDTYLDSALLLNYKNVTIIHGIGSGVLKKAIHQHLKKNAFIEEFRSGVYGEGGIGVTIVTFKKDEKK